MVTLVSISRAQPQLLFHITFVMVPVEGGSLFVTVMIHEDDAVRNILSICRGTTDTLNLVHLPSAFGSVLVALMVVWHGTLQYDRPEHIIP